MGTNGQKLHQTGGGVNKDSLVSPGEEATLLVINTITVNGLNNCYNDDYIKNEQQHMKIT